MVNKKELRQQIRAQKRAMTEAQIVEKSRILGEKFRACPQYARAKTVYGYLPYNQEVRTVPMLEQALKDGKKVAVPKVYGDEMKFILLSDLDAVVKGYAGIPEPIADGPEAADPEALVLMPGLVFDPQGHRIGYGGGFYDRFLPQTSANCIALCAQARLLGHVPAEPHDIRCGCIITEQEVVLVHEG